ESARRATARASGRSWNVAGVAAVAGAIAAAFVRNFGITPNTAIIPANRPKKDFRVVGCFTGCRWFVTVRLGKTPVGNSKVNQKFPPVFDWDGIISFEPAFRPPR